MSGIANFSLDRRAFIRHGLVSGSALILGFSLPGRPGPAAGGKRKTAGGGNDADSAELTAFILLDERGKATILNPFVEMGQGTYTTIPMLVAEEMDISLDDVAVRQAPHGPDYRLLFNNSARFTGGSLSVRSAFLPLRQAGAAARRMLLRAAAERWRLDPAAAARLATKSGRVVHPATGESLAYGELAAAAGRLPVPDAADAPLAKDRSAFRLLGTSPARLDTVAKVSGAAGFGIDQRLPGMLVAAVRQAPVFGAKVDKMETAAALAMPGVAAVETIPGGAGPSATGEAVAVLADQYWHAKAALEKLEVSFTGGVAGFSGAAHLRTLQSRVDEDGATAERHGDVARAFAAAAKTVTAEYHTPYLAHATMEPMNCTALVTADKCVVWTPNQGVDPVVAVAARITGMSPRQITVHTPFLGGGFGRRFMGDYVEQAVHLALKHRGKPVQALWSREEDMQHDFYRPMTAAKYRAALDGSGAVTALHTTTVGDGPLRRHFAANIGADNIDHSVIEGVLEQGYGIANRRHDYVYEHSPVPVGFWRSVGNSHNAFFNESFIDEIAHAAGQDPVRLRRALLAANPRFAAVLETAVKMADWRPKPYRNDAGARCAQGIALHQAYGTVVCQVAEVGVDSGRPRVHKVWCAVDCGFAIHPRIVAMQMESAIVYGLSAALHEEIKVENGAARNSNFDDYPVLSAAEMPQVRVEIVNSGAPLGGIGEAGTPPIAPALCNALFTLTGKRLRSLPVGRV